MVMFVDRNVFTKLPSLSYKIIEYLVYNNEIIWKLLKYSDADALKQSNLELEEKTALIYSGQEDSTPFKVFPQSFIDDGIDNRKSMIFIDVGQIYPENHVHGIVDFNIDVISHNKMLTLSDYSNRNVVLMQQVIETLSGKDINGLGEMFFNATRRGNNIGRLTYYNKIYQGYRIIMSSNI
jgi:hypothetical protein